jgi:hypothetical protein
MTDSGKHRVDGYNNAKNTPRIVLVLGIMGFLSCRFDNGTPDVSHLDGTFEMVRTEQTLFDIDSLMPAEQTRAVFSEHAEFWDLYFQVIMESDTAGGKPWMPVITNPYLHAISEAVAGDYSDMSDIREQLQLAFQYLQYYFPGNRVPNVYTLISGFGYFPFIFEDGERDGIGISLEMFLGSDFPYRTFTGNVNAFSDYLIRTYNRDHLVKRALDVVVDDLTGPTPGDRLIDIMIHNGIKLYLVEHLLPSMPDTVLFEMTPEQLDWCQANERNIWAHLLKDDLLYSNEFGKIQKLISPAPGIPGMPSEAPGGLANWTGWQIIHALNERNADLKMTDLLNVRDVQPLLEAARYRPR